MPSRGKAVGLMYVLESGDTLVQSLEAAQLSAKKQASVSAAVASLREAMSTAIMFKVVVCLFELASCLLEGVPYKWTQQSLRLLMDAHEAGCFSAEQRSDILTAAAVLFGGGLTHLNREVRTSTLALAARLSADMAGARPDVTDQILDSGVAAHCVHALGAACASAAPTAPSAQTLAAIEVLRGLLRNAHAVGRCREAGALPALLHGMPPSLRQGAIGAATSELLLRLSQIGGRTCALGSRLRAALLGSELSGGGELGGAAGADASMVYPDGGTLRLHRIALAVRAPEWLRMLTARAGTGVRGTGGGHGGPDGDGAGGGADGGGVSSDADTFGPARWLLSTAEAEVLPRAACGCLYELVLCGASTLPPSVRPRTLLGVAEALSLRALLLAPPTTPDGGSWLQAHYAAAAGADVGGVADVEFSLADGTLPAHSALLNAGSEYFRTMLAFQSRLAPLPGGSGAPISHGSGAPISHAPSSSASDSPHGSGGPGLRTQPEGSDPPARARCVGGRRRRVVRIEKVPTATFTVLLRYIYSGALDCPLADARVHLAGSDGGQPPMPSEALDGGAAGEQALLWRRLCTEGDDSSRWLWERLRACANPANPAGCPPGPLAALDAGGGAGTVRCTPRRRGSGAGVAAGEAGLGEGGLGRRLDSSGDRELDSSGDRELDSSGWLELAILARRYLLDELMDKAHAMLEASLSAADAVPLLLRAQEACDGEASDAIFSWAVERYEEVHAQLDHWIGCSPAALGSQPALRQLGALAASPELGEWLRGLLDQLRAAMLKRRHGL